ncbi:hypothetical protein JCM10207_003865 [Rhodosporidiobolus poonsookiae]
MATRSIFRRHPFLTTLVAVGTPTAVGLSLYFDRLARDYPALPVPPSSPLTTLADASVRLGAQQLFVARVPLTPGLRRLAALHDGSASTSKDDARSPNPTALTTAFARSFLSTPLFRLEACFAGLVVDRSFTPGDLGESGFTPAQKLMHGLFVVVEPPHPLPRAEKDGGGEEGRLTLRWDLGRAPVAFFEMLARYGYGWRLMNGGRHVLEAAVVPSPGSSSAEEEVELRFGCTADYNRVGGVYGGDDGKEIPEWGKRIHEAYARALLDEGVRSLKRAAKQAEREALER